jgi:hypothetical protein
MLKGFLARLKVLCIRSQLACQRFPYSVYIKLRFLLQGLLGKKHPKGLKPTQDPLAMLGFMTLDSLSCIFYFESIVI